MDVTAISEADMKTLTDQGYTKDDLALLADTEVQALLVPDSTDDDAGVDRHAAAAAEQDKQSGGKDADAEAAAAAAAAAAASETPPGDESNDDDASTAAFVPHLRAEVPADAATKIDDLLKEKADAFTQLMEGTLDPAKYQELDARVTKEVDALKTAALTADIFKQVNEQTSQQAAEAEWKRAESAAFKQFKEEGLDYGSKPALLAAYNTHLKALGADPKNDRRDASWFLSEAHRLTKADLGITAPPVTPKPGSRERGLDPNDFPPTLRGAPSAATSTVGADEFAHLRNLNGIELEKAVAKMSEAERDRWLSE